ncbi:MAG: hypothetical protein IPM91_13355 [Bacteroidetes bacterium]|nr:hypothetical protein [Bacteroidota bacterium]
MFTKRSAKYRALGRRKLLPQHLVNRQGVDKIAYFIFLDAKYITERQAFNVFFSY